MSNKNKTILAIIVILVLATVGFFIQHQYIKSVATTAGEELIGARSDVNASASTYTPTASNETNLDSAPTMGPAMYTRTGNTVTVSGSFTANPTGAGAVTFEVTKPIASTFTLTTDAAGMGFSGAVAGLGSMVYATTPSNAPVFTWTAVDTSARLFSYIYSYLVK